MPLIPLDKWLFAAILFFLIHPEGKNQSLFNDVTLKEVTNLQGLPSNITFATVQDQAGFIWFATDDGLVRFDGYSTRVFYRGTGAHDIGDNFIYEVFVDSKGRLWVGTNNSGLYEYDAVHERFISHPILLNGPIQKTLTRVRKIKEAPDGTLWIINQLEGVVSYHPETKKVQHFFHQPGNKNSLPSNRTLNLCFDAEKNIWITSEDVGVMVISTTGNLIAHYTNLPSKPGSLPGNTVHAVIQSSNGSIYIGTNKGLCQYEPSNETFKIIHPAETFAIHEKKSGELLTGTYGGMVVLENNKQISFVPTTKGFYDNHIRDIYEDSAGVIWLSTRSGGINYFYPQLKQIKTFRGNNNEKNSSTRKVIRGFSEDSEGNLWVATVYDGIEIYNPSENRFYNINSGQYKGIKLKNQSITVLLQDRENNMWVGTWGFGIFKLNKGSTQFENIYKNKQGEFIFQSNIILDMFEDSQGNIWVGTDLGLDVLNPKNMKVRRFSYSDSLKNSITPYGIQSGSIVEDIDGNFWVGTYGGLNYLVRKYTSQNIFEDEFEITNFYMNSGTNINLPDNRIISLHYNPKIYPDKIMGGTYGGGLFMIYFKNNAAQEIRSYTTREGLSNNVVFGILSDDSGNLWLSTHNGLTMFDKENNSFKQYGPNDGLQGFQFYWGAFYKDSKGYMYFGGTEGYSKLHPDSLTDNSYIPPVVLTDFRVFNNSVLAGDTVNGKVLLTKSVNYIEQIRLGAKENMFSIEFSALHYAFPEDNAYEYMLEGFDKKYIRVRPNQRTATYTNLDAGTYTFRVRGSNYDQVWNPIEKTMQIKVIPPFRKTLAFKLIAILLTMLVTGAWFYFRLKQMKIMRTMLQEKVQERTYELNRSNKLLQIQTKELIQANETLQKQKTSLNEINEQMLARTMQLNDMNAQLEERQQKVEEQSEEVRAQTETLINTNIELEKSNAAKDKFFSILSHDLKTPFNYILGSAEVLYRRFSQLDETKRLKYTQRIYQSAETTYNLLENLLTWSRAQSNRILPNPIHLKAFDIIGQCLQVLEGKIQSKELNIVTNISPELTVFVDNNMAHTVFLNVLTNAIKFSHRQGTIQIIASQEANMVKILFEDHGTGIPESKLKGLFRIDKSVSTIGTEGEPGTGLGLILCKEFITLSCGKISIESQENQGTQVIILLPGK